MLQSQIRHMDGETSKALLAKLEAKYTGSWIRMNDDETIRDYELRYTNLVTRINSLIKDLNGKEPPHPDTLLMNQLQSSQSLGGPNATVARTLRFGKDTPRKLVNSLLSASPSPSSSSSNSSSSGSQTAVQILLKNFDTTFRSADYKKASEEYTTWNAKSRPELQPAEIRRMFLANLNERYKKDINIHFTEKPQASINDIVKWAIRLESHSSPSKRVTPQVRFAPQDESAKFMEMLTKRLDEQDKNHKAELKRIREEQRALIKSKINTVPINAAHGSIHPSRQGQVNTGNSQQPTGSNSNNQNQQSSNQNTQQSYGNSQQSYGNSYTCELCGQQGHNGYSCMNMCIQCGLNHSVNQCQLNYDDLTCTKCGKTGHLAKACINSTRYNSSRGGGFSSRGRGGKRKYDGTKAKCFLWADGDCRFGKRCRFSHLASDKKNITQNVQAQQKPPAQAQPQPQYPIQPIFSAPPNYHAPAPPMPFYYPPPPMPPHMLQQPSPVPPPIPQIPPQSAMQAQSIKSTREQLLDKAVREYMAKNINASEQEATNSVISQVAEMTYKNLQSDQ